MRVFETILAMVAAYASLGAVSAAPTPCPTPTPTDGTYTVNSVCYLCPLGKHAKGTSSSSCTTCEAGTSTDAEGSTASTDCKACAVGKYQDVTTICKDCAVGKYQDLVKQTACKACPKGTYQDETKSKACKVCDAGKSTGTAETSDEASDCEDCAVGKYLEEGTWSDVKASGRDCDACATGRSTNSDGSRAATECKDCEAGKFKDTTSTPNACKDCEAGKYQDKVKQETCTKCAVGMYTTIVKQTVCKACDAGKTNSGGGSTTEGDCNDCAPGKYDPNDDFKHECVACPAGSFQDGTGKTVCKDCPIGKSQSAADAATATKVKCVDCVAGEFQDDVRQATCKDCPAGKYTVSTAQTACADCPAGYYQPNTKGEKCETCDPGTSTGDQKGSDEAADCEKCEIGKFLTVPVVSDWSASDIKQECTACDAGKTTDSVGKKVVGDCGDCVAGKYDSKNICVDCEVGKYQDVVAQTECKMCATGKVTPTGQSTAITDCSVDLDALEQVPVALTMESSAAATEGDETTIKGVVAVTLGVSDSQIKDFKIASTKTSRRRLFGVGSTPQSRILATYTWVVTFKVATAKTLSEVGGALSAPAFAAAVESAGLSVSIAASGIPCAVGEYKDLGSGACVLCAAGQFSASVGSEGKCTDCPAGTFSYTEGSTTSTKCLMCPKGTFSSKVAADSCSTCQMCPSESMAVADGATSAAQCAMCKAGKYNVFDSAGASCAACGTGKYAAAGAVACSTCAPGLYSTRMAASCSTCPAGSVLDDQGVGDRSVVKIKIISKGFDPMNLTATSTLEIADKDGKAFPFSNDWVKRGFNVAWFNGKTGGLNTTKAFDTYMSKAESDSMLAFLGDIPVGDAVAMFVFDDGQNNLQDDLMTYLELNFGAAQIRTLAFRSSYALVAAKGGAAMGEGSALVGAGGVTLEAAFSATTSCSKCGAGKYEAAGECEVCAVGKASSAGAAECKTCPGGREVNAGSCSDCGAGKSSAPGGTCTACAAGRFNVDLAQGHKRYLVATSTGFDVGPGVSITSKVLVDDVAYDEVIFDSASAKRGFNVLTLTTGTGTLGKSNANFDTYASAAESAALLAYLTNDVVVGAKVVITVYDEGSRFLGDDVKAYLAAEFKAEKVASLSFRDSYALIAKKGQDAPISEFAESLAPSFAAAGARAEALVFGSDKSSCWAAGPNQNTGISSSSSVVEQCPKGEYSAGGAVACTKCPAGNYYSGEVTNGNMRQFQIKVEVSKDLAGSTELPTVKISKCENFGNQCTLVNIPAAEFNTTWVKQGFNVVEFDLDSSKVSWFQNFDTSTSKAESDRLLAYLQALPATPRKLYAFYTHLDASANLGEDTKAYLASFFDAPKVAALGMNDRYAVISFKGGRGINGILNTCTGCESYASANSAIAASVDSTAKEIARVYPASCAKCAAGLYGKEEGLDKATCSGECKAGQFSAEGSKECTACAPGQFSAGVKKGECDACTVTANLAATGMEEDAKKKEFNCLLCPAGSAAKPAELSTPYGAASKKKIKVVATSSTADGVSVAELTVDGLSAAPEFILRRGFNVFVLDKDTGLAKLNTHYDTSAFKSDSDAMLTWMQGLTLNTDYVADDVFAFIVYEDASLKLGADVKAYLAANFGAKLVSNLALGAGYALISKKAAGVKSLSEVSLPAKTKGPSAETTWTSTIYECSMCAAGAFGPGGRLVAGSSILAVSMCTQCTAGKYSAEQGASECAQCEAGKTSQAQPTGCKLCAAGEIADETRACVQCKAGQYAPTAAGSEVISLTATSRGWLLGPSTFKVAVLEISALGVKLVSRVFSNAWVGRGLNVVQLNPATGAVDSAKSFDTYDKDKTASADMLAHLMAMPAGTIVAIFANDSANNKEANSLSPDLKAYLAANFGATMLDSLGFRDMYALIAPKGGAAYKEAFAKENTAAGVTVETFVQVVPKSDACKNCPPGRAQNGDGKTECDDCVAGMFAIDDGLTACVNCDAGKYQAATGMTACIECAAGKWADATAPTTECSPCDAGKFRATPGGAAASECSKCAAGMYNALTTGVAACVLCTAGKKSADDFESCTDCGAGNFNDVFGGASCQACAKGYYQALAGQTKCSYCGDGLTTTSVGSKAATDCKAARRRLRSLA